MSNLILTLLLLSAPGLLFGLGRRWASRTSQREARDIFGALAELVLLSPPLAFISVLVALFFLPADSRALFDWVSHWNGSIPAILSSHLVQEGLNVLGISYLTCLLLGFGYGCLRTWIPGFGVGARLPLEKLLVGLLPPGAYATVLTTTRLEGGIIAYRGWVEYLQMSPEGRIDFIALREAEKAFLDKPASGAPKASDFGTIVEDGVSESDVISILIIESEDIANVLLTKIPGARRPSPLESLLHLISRLLPLAFERARRLFPQSEKTKTVS